jgi:Protein of unknown function (DUF3105)
MPRVAKKSRTPPPPRRPQGPKQRTSAPARGAEADARSRLILYGIAGAGLLGLVIVVLVVVLAGGGTSAASAATTLRDAGCKYRKVKELPRSPHYQTLTPKTPPKWDSFPPTSGRHYVSPLVFGQYDQPVLEIQAVHNLEHGAVIVQYGDKVSARTADKITAWYREDPNAVVVAPLPKLGDKIALTAWTKWAECSKFDEKAFNAFRKAFRYKAPEKFPPDLLKPGE